MSLTDTLAAYGSAFNYRQNLFVNLDRILLSEQQNMFVLKDKDQWLEFRKEAMVTGSTAYNSIGLGKLKQQQEHFDTVIHRKPKQEPSSDIRKRMEYGTSHEIDAVATLTAKKCLMVEMILS